MSDAIIQPPKDSPRWARRIILALTVPTAILLALVGLFVARIPDSCRTVRTSEKGRKQTFTSTLPLPLPLNHSDRLGFG